LHHVSDILGEIFFGSAHILEANAWIIR